MMTEENNWVVHQSFRTTEVEDELIRQKMKVFGIRKKSLLFRAMVLNGYLLKLDLPEIRELIRLMKNLTNNVNQIILYFVQRLWIALTNSEMCGTQAAL